jgi:hypothetical protein
MIGQKNYGARMSNSIAKNHLSSLAQKGRHGDDRILQFSDGRVEHGNAFEEKLMGEALGESLVDAIGSKTINPETGLRENWVFETLTLLLGAGSSYASGALGEDAAKVRLDEATAGKEDVEKSQMELTKAYEAQRNLINQKYASDMEQITESKGQITESFVKASGRQDFSKASGDLELQKTQAQETLERKSEGMLGEAGRTLGDIASNYEQSRAKLRAEKERFEREISLSQQASDKWYLGKNIRGWGDPDKFWS